MPNPPAIITTGIAICFLSATISDLVIEDNFLGTAGSLKLLENKLNNTFFVSNCDIIIDDDYFEIYKNHVESKNHITIVVAIKNIKLQYGTINLDNNGNFLNLSEKPEFNFFVNTGMYILEPNILNLINDNEFINITDVIDKAKENGYKVGIYPIKENSWYDIGDWKEYYKTLENYDK